MPLAHRRVLIAEDEAATDLTGAVQDAHGEVVGPVATVAEGLAILAAEDVHAAILDVQLADGEITPVAHLLFGRGKTVLFHTATGVPREIIEMYGKVTVCRKPSHSGHVVRRLVALMEGFAEGNPRHEL